jgi:hypothetical protein
VHRLTETESVRYINAEAIIRLCKNSGLYPELISLNYDHHLGVQTVGRGRYGRVCTIIQHSKRIAVKDFDVPYGYNMEGLVNVNDLSFTSKAAN